MKQSNHMELGYKIAGTSIEDSEGTKHKHIINILPGSPLKTQCCTIRCGAGDNSGLHATYFIRPS